MGGIVGSTFTAVTPQMVHKLVMVDIIKPMSTPAKLQPDKSAKALDTYMEVLKKLEQSPPSYSYEIARDRLVAANRGSIDAASAEVLMRRGAKQIEDGTYFFSRDLRLVNYISSFIIILIYLNTHHFPGHSICRSIYCRAAC